MDFEVTNLQDRLKRVCNFFDRYDHLEVNKTTNGATIYFEADGVFKDAADYLIFTRRFADSIITDSPVVEAELNSDKATIYCRDGVYEMHPTEFKKELAASGLPDEFFIDDLMVVEYMDCSKLINKDGVVSAPISLEKLGALNKKQEVCIKKIIARLGGLSVHTQCRRIVAFSAYAFENKRKIWAHIYNLETATYINSIKLYDNEEDLFIPTFEYFAASLCALSSV